MKDPKALAYVNAYGVLACLENMCELDAEAKAICAKIKKPVGLCFEVTDGPCVTYTFSKDGCKMTEGDAAATCKMKFASPEKFNALIDEGKPGMPVQNPVQCLTFLLTTFTKLTDKMSAYLQPEESALKDKDFFRMNTILTFYVISGAICALGNNDEISKLSASYMPNGAVEWGIKDVCYASVYVNNGVLTLDKNTCPNPRAKMAFNSIELANGLFNGTVSTIAELCAGNIQMSGMINMVDNLNRILDRVAVYLG